MDTESQWIYDRMQLHQLQKKHPTWSSTQLAAAVGRSERWARKWLQRFRAVEKPTFEMYQSQSRAPKTRPRQTNTVVKDRICELREELSDDYHRHAGAPLIRHHLLADTELQEAGHFIPTSTRTITQILHERGYIQRQRPHQRMPLTRCEPHEEWEIDFCEIRVLEERFEFFVVVDRGTSRVIYVEGSEGYRADSAIRAVVSLFAQHGLPQRLRLDRDPRFVGSWSSDGYPSPLVRLLHVVGVTPVICPPRRPDKKPYVERCIRTFKHEWLDRFSLQTIADCYEALDAFPHYHNAERLHFGRACNGQTPDDAFPRLPQLPALPDQVDPNSWLPHYHGRVYRRRIRSNGSIQIDKHIYYVDAKLAKSYVLVQLDALQRELKVFLHHHQVASLPLKGLFDTSQLELYDYLKEMREEAVRIAQYRHERWQQSAELA